MFLTRSGKRGVRGARYRSRDVLSMSSGDDRASLERLESVDMLLRSVFINRTFFNKRGGSRISWALISDSISII